MNESTGTVTEIYFAHCIRCGRKLTNERSKRNGYGRKCRGKLNYAARQVALTFSEAQVVKAATALRTSALSYCDRGVYRFVASNGHDVYWTAEDSCTCPAGAHGRRCYHRCAVKIRELTPYFPGGRKSG